MRSYSLVQQDKELRKSRHEKQLEEKRKLLKALPYKEAFEAKIAARRQEVYEREKAAQDARQSDLRARIAELKEQRRLAEEKRKAE